MKIIAAVDKNMGIGRNNQLLAHIKPDLEYFKTITEGSVVVMGYNTYESLPIKPLPNRENIVLTRKLIRLEGCKVARSIKELFGLLENYKEKEIFVIGGASVYKQLLPYADKLYITHIFDEFYAETFFPEIGPEWEITSIKGTRENIGHEYPHVFTVYEKKKA